MAILVEWSHRFLVAVSLSLEVAAALIILAAATRAFVRFARQLGRAYGTSAGERHDLRLRFGRSLLLALDFTIGSDVLEVAARRDMQSVLVVGLVVLVRILLTLVLEHEIRREEERDARRAA